MELRADRVEIYGDSMLVINQILDSYQYKNPTLARHLTVICKLIEFFKDIEISHVLRESNHDANELAKIVSGTTIDADNNSASLTVFKRTLPAYQERTY